MNKKELQELIKQGEGYFVEFKKQVGESLDREMVAFANASGGKIVIGVADDGRVTGCSTDNMTRSKIQDIANNCDPRIPIHIKAERGIEIAFDTGDFFIVTLARQTAAEQVGTKSAPS